MFLLLLATMPKNFNILHKLPDDKIKLMMEKKNVVHIKIGDQTGIYCLPNNLMAMTCPCGVFKDGYQTFNKHLSTCSLYLSFKEGMDYDSDDTVKFGEKTKDTLFTSISFKSYQELRTQPASFTYGGRCIAFAHHSYLYLCPCGKHSTNYYNLFANHITQKTCEFTRNNYYEMKVGSSHLFQPDPPTKNDGKTKSASPSLNSKSSNNVDETTFLTSLVRPSASSESSKEKVGTDADVDVTSDKDSKKKSRMDAEVNVDDVADVGDDTDVTLKKKSRTDANVDAVANVDAIVDVVADVDVDVDVDVDASYFIKTLHASSDSVKKKSQCVLDDYNYPFDTKRASFQVPSTLEPEQTSLLEQLQHCLTVNYDAVCKLVEGAGTRSRRNWGATAIQGTRYMIKLDGKDNQCWDRVVKSISCLILFTLLLLTWPKKPPALVGQVVNPRTILNSISCLLRMNNNKSRILICFIL